MSNNFVIPQTVNTPSGKVRTIPAGTPNTATILGSTTNSSTNGINITAGSLTVSGTSWLTIDGSDYTIQPAEGYEYWENFGLLEGLNDEQKNYLAHLLDEAEEIVGKDKEDPMFYCGIPIIRRVYGDIMLEKKSIGHKFYSPDNIIREQIADLISVKDIIDLFKKQYDELLPILKKSLPDLDNEAEFCKLVSDQYVSNLVNNFEIHFGNTLDIWDVFGLFKISEAYFVDIDNNGDEYGFIEFVHVNTDEAISINVKISYDNEPEQFSSMEILPYKNNKIWYHNDSQKIKCFEYFDDESEKTAKKYGIDLEKESIKKHIFYEYEKETIKENE